MILSKEISLVFNLSRPTLIALSKSTSTFIGKANLPEWSGIRSEWGHLKGQVFNGLSERGEKLFPPTDRKHIHLLRALEVALRRWSNSRVTWHPTMNMKFNNKMALATERHIRPVAFSPDETGITGPDPRDEVTLHQPGLVPDHLGALDENALVVESSFAMPNNRKGVSTHLLTPPELRAWKLSTLQISRI